MHQRALRVRHCADFAHRRKRADFAIRHSNRNQQSRAINGPLRRHIHAPDAVNRQNYDVKALLAQPTARL